MGAKPSSALIGVLVVLVIVAGVGGYFAGSSAVPPPKTITSVVTQTVTTTVAAATQTITSTVTQPAQTITTTVTLPPQTVTVTVTPTPTPTVTPPPPTPPSHWPKSLVFRGGAVGSSWTVFASVVASVIEKDLKVSVRVEPGGSLANTMAIARGEVELALSQTAWMPVFMDPAKIKNLTGESVDASKIKILANAVLPFYFELVYTRPDSPINSVEDIARMIKEGKPLRIGVGGAAGSIDDIIARLILEAYGIKPADITRVGGSFTLSSESDVVSKIQEGKLDVVFETTMPGASAYRELEIRMPDVKLLPLIGKERDYLLNFFTGGGLYTCSLPKDLFKFVTKEYATLCTSTIIIVNADLPEDLVYFIAMSIDKNEDYIKSSIAAFDFNPEEVWKTLGGVGLHPGAAKYYKDAGYMK
ncbi:MAG: TAXI family TRAP transporter solute-binding subunit [Sulfolobales archaeon]